MKVKDDAYLDRFAPQSVGKHTACTSSVTHMNMRLYDFYTTAATLLHFSMIIHTSTTNFHVLRIIHNVVVPFNVWIPL